MGRIRFPSGNGHLMRRRRPTKRRRKRVMGGFRQPGEDL